MDLDRGINYGRRNVFDVSLVRILRGLRIFAVQATELGASSLALPAISTGIFGYPKEAGVRVIVEEVLHWLEAHAKSPVHHIHFAAFDAQTATLFATAVAD